jgi:lipopolysaccharide-induced tumor necrosis factor-alpha factor
MHVLLPSKRNDPAAMGVRPPLDSHHTDPPPRRFSLGIISLGERWSARRSSIITTTSTGVSMLQGAREHEEVESRSSRKRVTPPSSLRNQFRKFYTSSVTTLSTSSLQSHNNDDNGSLATSRSSQEDKSVEPAKNRVHANWQPGLPDEPIHMDCPHCRIQVRSVTGVVNGRLVWVTSFILFLSTIVLACVPCCIPWLKDVQHRCPECHNVLGRYRRW